MAIVWLKINYSHPRVGGGTSFSFAVHENWKAGKSASYMRKEWGNLSGWIFQSEFVSDIKKVIWIKSWIKQRLMWLLEFYKSPRFPVSRIIQRFHSESQSRRERERREKKITKCFSRRFPSGQFAPTREFLNYLIRAHVLQSIRQLGFNSTTCFNLFILFFFWEEMFVHSAPRWAPGIKMLNKL